MRAVNLALGGVPGRMPAPAGLRPLAGCFYSIEISSTSKFSVLLGGMMPGMPAAP